MERHLGLGVPEQSPPRFRCTGGASISRESRTRSSSWPSSAGRYARDDDRRPSVRMSDMRRSFLIVERARLLILARHDERSGRANLGQAAPDAPESSVWDLERILRRVPELVLVSARRRAAPRPNPTNHRPAGSTGHALRGEGGSAGCSGHAIRRKMPGCRQGGKRSDARPAASKVLSPARLPQGAGPGRSLVR